MTSKTLTTRAVIQAVDNLTGPLASMGSKVRSFSMTAGRHFDAVTKPLTGALGKLQSMPVMGGAFASGLFAGSLMHDQIALDKIARQTRAINEIGAPEWGGHLDKILSLGTKYGISQEDMIKGAKGWQELGNSVESYIKNADIAAKTSKITGISIGDQMKETSALVRAFGFDPKDHHKFREFERAYLVASKGMKGGAHAYGEAMKNFAPIAKSLGLNIHQASGFVQALGGQFEAGEIGNAFKMGFARLMAPTPKAHAALRAAGLDPLQFWSINKGNLLGSGHALAERLRGSGKVVSPGQEAKLSAIMRNADISKGGRVVSDQLLNAFTEMYGTRGKKGKSHLQGEDAKLASQVIAQHLASYRTGLNIEDFFKYMGGQADNVPLIKELFGGHHIAKFQDLFRQGEHVAHNIEKNTHYAEQFSYRMDRGATGFRRLIREDVIDRRAKIVLEGLSHQFERMSAAWKALWTGMGSSGITGDMARAFKGVADVLDKARHADPNKIRAIAWGLGALAALPIATFAGAALANSLKAIAALGMAPVRVLGALAAVPWAMTAAGMMRAGAATRLMGAAMAGNAMMGLSRFVGLMGRLARFTAMAGAVGGAFYAIEHWGETMAAFKGFASSEAGGAMFAEFSKLGNTVKGLATDLVSAGRSFTDLMGWTDAQSNKGGPAAALETMATWAKLLAEGLNIAATGLRAIFSQQNTLPDWMPDWMRKAHEHNMGEGRRQADAATLGGGWLDGLSAFLFQDTRGPVERFVSRLLGSQAQSGGDAFGVPQSFPPGTTFGTGTEWPSGFPVSTDASMFPTATDISSPIVEAQGQAAENVGGRVDAGSQAIVAAIQQLGPILAAAASAAASRASFGGPAAASQPAGGNATGAKR